MSLKKDIESIINATLFKAEHLGETDSRFTDSIYRKRLAYTLTGRTGNNSIIKKLQKALDMYDGTYFAVIDEDTVPHQYLLFNNKEQAMDYLIKKVKLLNDNSKIFYSIKNSDDKPNDFWQIVSDENRETQIYMYRVEEQD